MALQKLEGLLRRFEMAGDGWGIVRLEGGN